MPKLLLHGVQLLLFGLFIVVSAACATAQVIVIRAPHRSGLGVGTVLPPDQILELATGDSMDIVDLALRRLTIAGPYKGRAADILATAAPKIDPPSFYQMASVLASALSFRGGASQGDYRHVDLLGGGVQCAMTAPPAFRPIAAEAVERVTLTPIDATQPRMLSWREDQNRFEWPVSLAPVDKGVYQVHALLVQTDGLLKDVSSQFTLRTPAISSNGVADRDLRILLDAGCNAQVLRWAEQVPVPVQGRP